MADQATVPAPQCRSLWPKDALRIAFGVIWLIDAVLKWLPGFRASYMDSIMGTAQGQPGWLQPWFHFWINLQHPRSVFFAYSVAAVETVIALALIFGFARKVAYISGALFSFLIWTIAETFGGPYTSGASDIGAAIMYSVVFMALLALSYYAGPARYSLDFYLEQRISWWWKVAELRRPTPVATEPSLVSVGEASGTESVSASTEPLLPKEPASESASASAGRPHAVQA